ncbi:ATP-binding cassette domain-containing protein [Bifidobacterium aquikefiri]|uniref:ATP-binding cassette domain-containing protein n=3 Tax=Bifidobacterium aquikefiri TaxID=1653207 RepID=UPI0039EA82B8
MNIELHHVSVNYGEVQALADFSANFRAGEITVIIGGDGAGKSTLLKLLARGIKPSLGTISGLPDSQNIGYQSADSGTWANLSVQGNMNFVGTIFKMNNNQLHERMHSLVAQAQLDRALHRSARNLSGGMRQKLGCIMASLHDPDLLVLDEPTTGVDPISRNELWKLIINEAQHGKAVVVATTYVEEATRGTSMILLDKGRIVAEGSASDITRQSPGSLFSRPCGNNRDNEELDDDDESWRRGNTQYLWKSSSHAETPEGYNPAEIDIENACIIRLKARQNRNRKQQSHSIDPPDTAIVRSALQHVDNQNQSGRELLSAQDVTKRFGKQTALADVSLSVNAGEIVGLIGSNGAGKTTLMRVLLGLESPNEGQTTLMGDSPNLRTREKIGYVPQGLGLYPTLSAEQNLKFARSMYSHKLQRGNDQVTDTGGLSYTKALEFAQSLGGRPVQKLSLGIRRMLAYLIATSHDPSLLILDEPTSGVDPIARMELWDELHKAADRGVGILITTHYMSEAAQCDRCVLLSAGKAIVSGTVEEMMNNHSNPYITSLFKSGNPNT